MADGAATIKFEEGGSIGVDKISRLDACDLGSDSSQSEGSSNVRGMLMIIEVAENFRDIVLVLVIPSIESHSFSIGLIRFLIVVIAAIRTSSLTPEFLSRWWVQVLSSRLHINRWLRKMIRLVKVASTRYPSLEILGRSCPLGVILCLEDLVKSIPTLLIMSLLGQEIAIVEIGTTRTPRCCLMLIQVPLSDPYSLRSIVFRWGRRGSLSRRVFGSRRFFRSRHSSLDTRVDLLECKVMRTLGALNIVRQYFIALTGVHRARDSNDLVNCTSVPS